MKYIIIPILKFICALILSIVCFIISIVIISWTLKPLGKVRAYHNDAFQLSPYFQPEYSSTKYTEFKTIFHYIWGIKQKQ